MSLRFQILGPVLSRRRVERSTGATDIPLGPPKQRSMLALLLLAHGRFVSVDAIAEALWDGESPRSAVPNIRTYASRLRTAVQVDGVERLHGGTQGYAVRLVRDDEFDLEYFHTYAKGGRAALAQGDAGRAMMLLARALGCWQGAAGADLNAVGGLARRLDALEEQRLDAMENLVGAQLRLGRHAQLHDELRALTLAHPLRERLWADLMLARYRMGDASGSLAAYHEARAALRGELGVEPGAELAGIQRSILRRDPNLDLPGQSHLPDPPQPGRTAPRELPAALGSLVGREVELAAIRHAVEHSGPAPGVSREGRRGPCVVAVHGVHGVGTSALARHAAAAVSGRFPDGQLFIDIAAVLRAVGPDDLGLHVLTRLLRSLGEDSGPAPLEADHAAARFRSAAAERRLLLVLDNAADEQHVHGLIPAGDRCAVLIAGPNMLAGIDGVVHQHVRPLSTAHGVELLLSLCGPVRSVRDRRRLYQLAEQSGGLPRVLRAMASRLMTQGYEADGDSRVA